MTTLKPEIIKCIGTEQEWKLNIIGKEPISIDKINYYLIFSLPKLYERRIVIKYVLYDNKNETHTFYLNNY